MVHPLVDSYDVAVIIALVGTFPVTFGQRFSCRAMDVFVTPQLCVVHAGVDKQWLRLRLR